MSTDLKHNQLEKVTVRLKWLHQAQFAGMYVAESKGYYKDNGLEVSLIERDLKASTIDELLEGKVDIAIVDANQIFLAHEARKDIKAVAAIYQHSPSVIAALKSSNINVPKDLKGRKLGITTDTLEARLMYNALLADSRIDPSTVSYEVGGSNQATNLLTHKMDAVSMYRTGDLYMLDKLGEEYALILPEMYGYERYDDIIVVSNTYLKENGETVRKFLKATIKGWEYALEHVDEAARLSRQRAVAPYFDLDFHQFVIEQSKPLIEAHSTSKIGDMDYIRWKMTYDFLRQHELIGDIDVQNIYTVDYLK